MNIIYTLEGTGWAECKISIDDKACTTTASYLSDSLKSLVEAAILILKGSSLEKFSFDEEPGEYRWVLEAVAPDELSITIIEFESLWGDKPDSEGVILFKEKSSVKSFAIAVKRALDFILSEYGVLKYKKMWYQHDFPMREYKELSDLLAKMPV